MVRDVWNNARNHTTDVIQLLDYNPATNAVADPWTNCEVSVPALTPLEAGCVCTSMVG